MSVRTKQGTKTRNVTTPSAYRFSGFTLQGVIYTLKTPLLCPVEQEDGYFIECPEYKIYGQGKTLQAAELELASVFSTLYKQYALEDDSRLTGDAQQLKRRLLEEVAVASYSAGDFIKVLKKKGFEYQPEVTHHEYYALYYNGIKTSIYTYLRVCKFWVYRLSCGYRSSFPRKKRIATLKLSNFL